MPIKFGQPGIDFTNVVTCPDGLHRQLCMDTTMSVHKQSQFFVYSGEKYESTKVYGSPSGFPDRKKPHLFHPFKDDPNRHLILSVEEKLCES